MRSEEEKNVECRHFTLFGCQDQILPPPKHQGLPTRILACNHLLGIISSVQYLFFAQAYVILSLSIYSVLTNLSEFWCLLELFLSVYFHQASGKERTTTMRTNICRGMSAGAHVLSYQGKFYGQFRIPLISTSKQQIRAASSDQSTPTPGNGSEQKASPSSTLGTAASTISQLSAETRAKAPTNSGDDIANIASRIHDAVANPYPTQAPPHHLHVFSHKHNTHITLTRPNRDPLLSLSCGNLGFRKSQRGNYDASHQLSSHVMAKIQERGYLMDIKRLEVVMKGFGSGREAFTKALLGSEGKNIRRYVVRVTDATKLKFGGTRSRRVRRLG